MLQRTILVKIVLGETTSCHRTSRSSSPNLLLKIRDTTAVFDEIRRFLECAPAPSEVTRPFSSELDRSRRYRPAESITWRRNNSASRGLSRPFSTDQLLRMSDVTATFGKTETKMRDSAVLECAAMSPPWFCFIYKWRRARTASRLGLPRWRWKGRKRRKRGLFRMQVSSPLTTSPFFFSLFPTSFPVAFYGCSFF